MWIGGTNFVWLAILTLALSGATHARNIIISLMIMLWGARLSGFLLFRILKTGSDDRFDDKRDKFFPFLGFWVFQMFWCWTVSLPVTFLNSPNVLQYRQPDFGKATDIISIIIFVIAFTMEAVSDIQKYRFKQGPGKEPGAVCDVGFFKWSRHPNYFGEIMVQVCEYIHQLIIVLMLMQGSNLHYGRHARELQERPVRIWSVCSPVRIMRWLHLLDHSFDVRLWTHPPGTTRCEETIREGLRLARL